MDKTLWFAFLFVSEVVSLQCYVCNTLSNGEDCASADKLKSSQKFLKNCSDLPDGERYTYCRKMLHQIPNKEGRGIETRVVRECGYLNTTMNTCKNIGMHKDAGQIMCSCDADLCNSSSQLKAGQTFISWLTLIGISFFLKTIANFAIAY